MPQGCEPWEAVVRDYTLGQYVRFPVLPDLHTRYGNNHLRPIRANTTKRQR